MDAKRNCSRNWFVWRLFLPLSKDQLMKKREITHSFTLSPKLRLSRCCLCFHACCDFWPAVLEPRPSAFSAPTSLGNSLEPSLWQKPCMLFPFQPPKCSFIFSLLAYLPASGGQMRIPFSSIPNFSGASQEINSLPKTPILWDMRLSLLGKAVTWHRERSENAQLDCSAAKSQPECCECSWIGTFWV